MDDNTEIEADKNEPGRFLGEGVSFRAKLIGVLEVPEARGDRMCQEALADLKMAIRAAGEHKQRIQVHVAIDGLRLRDDKTGDSLYHHPVHKISFIAQDMTDSRAFGYIFGSPDTGHRFFGIKTDKAASQVVIAMRDLFQVVFELKKKEIELAKQQLEGKSSGSSLSGNVTSVVREIKSKSVFGASESCSSAPVAAEETGVADLVDLEQELSSLRRGLTQVEGLTPSNDPFGDSFIATHRQTVVLPPPPSRARPTATSPPAVNVTPASQVTPAGPVTPPVKQVTASRVTPAVPQVPPPSASVSISPVSAAVSLDPLADPLESPAEPRTSTVGYDVFTELDPLGTGRSRPYVDKKLFFQELKNPPKKVLKDLVPSNNTALLTDILSDKPSLPRQSASSVGGASRTIYADPFADTDPFDSTDPFEDSFRDDPFSNAPEIPNSKEDLYRYKVKPTLKEDTNSAATKSVFNGALQVTLPPEPVTRSPRLHRKCEVWSEFRGPPRPPKKDPPAPRAPDTPPLPPPARRTDRYSRVQANMVSQSSEDEYVTPAPPPLPAARHLDLSLTHLLTCDMEQLSHRLRVPVATLSSMTLPQLTAYLRSYLAADVDRSRIHVEPTDSCRDLPKPVLTAPIKTTSFAIEKIDKPVHDEFEDNFTPPTTANETNGTFVADFDDFDKKINPSYDRYAAFREIQQEELKTKSVLTTDEQSNNEDNKSNSDDREEFTSLGDFNLIPQDKSNKELSHSPLKSLDELTLDSFNMFRNTVSPKPIDSKIEDIKNVMKNLQLDNSRRSVSPRDNSKRDDANDRYAALRDITITEPQDEFESLPPDVPKERKRSDEKSDGFDNSDFFDCIDNSSLSYSHVEDAFRKSPSVREKEELVIGKKTVEMKSPALSQRKLQPVISVGSLSDVASGSSPETKEAEVCREGPGGGGRWSVLAGGRGGSPSTDSDTRTHWTPPAHTHPHTHTHPHSHHAHRKNTHRQTSSSSRDMSWDEEPPSRKSTHSRHNSSGSRECLDSGSGRDKDKKREKRNSRERERDHRDDRESVSTRERDRRDSGSGRDRDRERRDSKDRDHRRDRRSRERDKGMWDRERDYSREREYRDSRSRDRTSEYRDKDRDRHRKQPPSWDEDDEDYSEGCGSGRSSPRERWTEQRWRRDDRNYGSLGWRERRRSDRKEDASADRGDRRYGATLSWSSRRSTSSAGSGSRRDERRRPRRDERHRRRDRDYDEYDNHYGDTTPHNKRTNYSNLEGTRFAFESEEVTASPMSGSSNRAHDGGSPATRFRFDSDSVSPRSLFEDDFTTVPTIPPSRGRAASIAEEDEDVPPLRNKPTTNTKHIKKSDSVNIFVRESDPFENDDFFACTGSDRAARRENWPGDFNAFEHS